MSNAFLWLFIIGLLLFIAAMIGYEATRRKTLPTWAGALMIVGVTMILVATVIYMKNSMVTMSTMPPRGSTSAASAGFGSAPVAISSAGIALPPL